jgi:hypothetical protein
MSLYATNTAEAMRHSVMAKAMGFDSFKAGLEILYDSSDQDGDDEMDDDDGNDSDEIGSCYKRSFDAEERPQAKRTRIYHQRSLKAESNWWRRFLAPEKRQLYASEPNGRDSLYFRQMFQSHTQSFMTSCCILQGPGGGLHGGLTRQMCIQNLWQILNSNCWVPSLLWQLQRHTML